MHHDDGSRRRGPDAPPASEKGARAVLHPPDHAPKDSSRIRFHGQLAGVSVAKSSGHRALDKAARRAVQSVRGLSAAPNGLTDASYSFTLPITFSR
ncbi:MAG: energy transducer TonB [Paracoccaceae bacterium]